MATQAQIRVMLASKLFTTSGNSPRARAVTHRTQSSTYNNYGDVTAVTNTDATIACVFYDISQSRLEFERFSAYNPGDCAAAVPYTVTISPGDLIVDGSTTWKVMEVVPHYLPENLVTTIRLSKVVA